MTRATLFPTSVVGSMPRPQHVRDLVMGRRDLSADEYEKQMAEAVRSVVEMQERAGLADAGSTPLAPGFA